MDGGYDWPQTEDSMQFRLTYAGKLPSTQRERLPHQYDRLAGVRHDIRKVFHSQLKRLWEVNANLNGTAFKEVIWADVRALPPRTIPEIAEQHAMYGWNFVPLVTAAHDLLCSLDILFLRPTPPGNVWAGDIDNRIKTLFDALQIPDANERYHNTSPDDDQKPFFCLFENDKLITKIAVETDELLEPVGAVFDPSDVRLVINVELRPYFINIANRHFG